MSAAVRDRLRARLAAALAAVEPAAAVRAHLQPEAGGLRCGGWRHPLGGRVVVAAAGKAAAPMAQAVEALLGDRLSGGMAVTKRGHGLPLERIRLVEAGHPVPDAAGLAAAAALLAEAAGLEAGDLLLCCLSGGASALLPAPRPPLALADLQALTGALLASGADIAAVNTVRRHCSLLAGGRLALAAAPARVLTLAISDVPGDDPVAIGSGPTVADPTHDRDAWRTLGRWLAPDRLPPALARLIATADQAWTAEPGDPRLAGNHYAVVAGNRQALAAAAPDRVLADLAGEARSAAARFCAAAADLPAGTLAAAGGETTVRLGPLPGEGGRNQEFALACAQWIAERGAPLTVLAAGSDGGDGPTGAAGGLVDGGTWARIRAAGLDPQAHLDRHDALPALRAAGDLLITGPTRTNVMDLALAWRA